MYNTSQNYIIYQNYTTYLYQNYIIYIYQNYIIYIYENYIAYIDWTISYLINVNFLYKVSTCSL